MAVTTGSDVKGRRALRFVCPVPTNSCTGMMGFDGMFRCHSTQEQVRQCEVSHLLKQGYTKVGSREFEAPNGGRILVLSKKAERSKPGKADRPMLSKSRLKIW